MVRGPVVLEVGDRHARAAGAGVAAGEVGVDALRRRAQVALHRGEVRRRLGLRRRGGIRRDVRVGHLAGGEQVLDRRVASVPAGSVTAATRPCPGATPPVRARALAASAPKSTPMTSGSSSPGPATERTLLSAARRELDLEHDLRLHRGDRPVGGDEPRGRRAAARRRGSAPACRSGRPPRPRGARNAQARLPRSTPPDGHRHRHQPG